MFEEDIIKLMYIDPDKFSFDFKEFRKPNLV